MNGLSQLPKARQIEAEACAWIAQLDGADPSHEDLQAFREWLGRSPLHREEMKRLSSLWGELNVLTELAVPLGTSPRKSPWRRGWLVSAASAGILLLSVMAGYHFFTDRSSNEYFSTAIGEESTAVLADGSVVQLNTDTQLQVATDGRQRLVHLLKGEAFFDVAHDSKRPFLVVAGANTVRAVGTAFSVRQQAKNIEVVVAEGVVEVSTASRGTDGASRASATTQKERVTKLAALTAGHSAVFSQRVESVRSIDDGELLRKLSWRTGVLSFSGEPLADVVDEVGRYTRTTIVIADPAISNIKIGGYFKTGEVDAVLDALEATFEIRVTRVNDRLVYLSAKK